MFRKYESLALLLYLRRCSEPAGDNRSETMNNQRPTCPSIESEEDDDVVIRVALIGDSGVGKSAIVSHLCADLSDRGGLYTPTVGCDVEVLAIQSEEDPNETFFVELWDIGGNPHYEAARGRLYAECDGFIFVWDADAVHTFHSLENWLSEVLRNKGNLLDEELEDAEEGNEASIRDHDFSDYNDVDVETGKATHTITSPLSDMERGTGSGDREDDAKGDGLSHLRSRQDRGNSRIKDRRVRNAPRSSSRRYSSGSRLTSAKYSSGTLDSIMNSQRSSVPYGRRDQGDIFGGSSSIINSLINRKRHTHPWTSVDPQDDLSVEGGGASTTGGPLSFLTSIFGGGSGMRSSSATEKLKVDNDVIVRADDDTSQAPPSPRMRGASSPSSTSFHGNRKRGDSLVGHFGIQSPEKTASSEAPVVVREEIEEESEADLDVEAGGVRRVDQDGEVGGDNDSIEDQVDDASTAASNEVIASPGVPTGLSRRKIPLQSTQQQYHQSRRGSTGKRSRGTSFPHGGLPLMIVANKVDKVGQRDQRSLRSTCSNHVFTSATFESYMDEKPFYNFFYEIKRVYSHTV